MEPTATGPTAILCMYTHGPGLNIVPLSLTAMTERMVLRYTDFPDLASYLRGYAITGPVLADLAVPTHLVAAADDPVIPVNDLDGLARTPALRVTVTGSGGHCGFVEQLRGPSWIDRVLADELAG